MSELIQLKYIMASIIYSFIGIFILVVSFYIIEKITPEDLWKEIINKNLAVAIMAAAYILAIAIIISSAIHS